MEHRDCAQIVVVVCAAQPRKMFQLELTSLTLGDFVSGPFPFESLLLNGLVVGGSPWESFPLTVRNGWEEFVLDTAGAGTAGALLVTTIVRYGSE